MNTERHSLMGSLVLLEQDLRKSMRFRIRSLRLELRDAGVVLLGQAKTYYDKQIAQERELIHDGLQITANEIMVG